MFDPEKLCELIDSYNKNFGELKLMHESVKKLADVSPDMEVASWNLEKILETMQTGKVLLKQTQIICEIAEAKKNASEEELQELEEMLQEF